MASIQDMLDAARPVCSRSKDMLLKGDITRSAMRVSDVEAAIDATTAFGDLRVDTMVCAAWREPRGFYSGWHRRRRNL